MELLPTIQTYVGMVSDHGRPQQRVLPFESIPNGSGWTFVDAQPQALIPTDKDDQFPTYLSWGNIPHFLAECYTAHHIPRWPSQNQTRSHRRNTERPALNMLLLSNFLTMSTPTSMDTLKRLIVSRQRIDVEQAVALVLQLLPEHAAQLIELVPTIITKSCMWIENLPDPVDVDARRRQHICDLLSLAKVTEPIAPLWEDLAGLLFRVRRNRPRDLTCGLRLPDWLRTYLPESSGVNQMLSPLPYFKDFIVGTSTSPLVVSKKHYLVLNRYIIRLVSAGPAKNLRRDIQSLSRRLVYGDDKRRAIEMTTDKRSLAYTFIGAQRRLQQKVVSNLHGSFLAKGQSVRIQQNTPYKQTSFEESLGQIAHAGGTEGPEAVDWTVLTAIHKPIGVESLQDGGVEELLLLVDRICECFERYVFIHGGGSTEQLRPRPGRRGGFRGPVDDWNAAADVLAELRRLVEAADYAVVDAPAAKESVETSGEKRGVRDAEAMDCGEEDFVVVQGVQEKHLQHGMALPRARKFLALDIMSAYNSWEDDVFAETRMPPEFSLWLEMRRAQGKCPAAENSILLN